MVNKTLLTMGLVVSAIFLVSILGGCSDQRKADNTGINERDMAPGAVTADQQGQSSDDIQITADIRQAVLADKSLSTYANNLKIITRDGLVTLKGPVGSADEKRAIEEKATQIAGNGRVTSEIDIAS